MIDKVKVRKTGNPEDGYENSDELRADTLQHIHDVSKVMATLGMYLIQKGYAHDWSKLEYFDEFKRDTLERQDIPNFKDREWYKIHTEMERHHINANVPSKVNLFDLIELICDCTIAGKSRTGEVNNDFLVVSQSVINSAYWNTVKLINDVIVLEDD